MKQHTSIADQKKIAKSHRQWSIMLIGSHGRVIPLRRFLPLAVIGAILVVLGISAITGLSMLYGRQVRQMQALQTRMDVLHETAEDLKHERDMYLAKVVIIQEQLDNLNASQFIVASENGDSRDKGTANDGASSEMSPIVDKPAKVPQEEAVAATAPVSWRAETEDFNFHYDFESKSIRIDFKIYNKSVPKEALSGRCVVVLKHKDDPPVKWIALPSVLLADGKPAGDTGYAFRIQNYRTIRLTARNLKAPVEFNTASISIFLGDGSLLYQRDYGFSITPLPPEPPPKSQPASAGEADRSVRVTSQKAGQHDGSIPQKNQGNADPATAPDQSAGPQSAAPVLQPSDESATIDRPASNASTGPKLEGAAQ